MQLSAHSAALFVFCDKFRDRFEAVVPGSDLILPVAQTPSDSKSPVTAPVFDGGNDVDRYATGMMISGS
jgi:hypothetical protein